MALVVDDGRGCAALRLPPVFFLGTDENERVTEVLVYILYFKQAQRLQELTANSD